VGWSLFDRDLVKTSNLHEDLRQTWCDRYVNALPIAKIWRSTMHPKFVVAKASRFDPKHTLDQYAELAGYPDVAVLRGGEPARWIRHLHTQIGARTHYRRVTRQTKRDWHKLLDYNRHDCFALKHVYLKASSELQKWSEYKNTEYFVFEEEGKSIRFRVGSTKPRLDMLLDRYGARRWALITAWNPASQQLPPQENQRRQDELLARLFAAGYRCLKGEGRGIDTSWPPEESVFALDIPEAAAKKLGGAFGQLAIVAGHRRGKARLVACL
jgi:hypothetical protein